MFDIVKRLFLGSVEYESIDENDYDEKKAGLERLLGPVDEEIDYTSIPDYPGLDLFTFSQCLPGTAFATMELIKPFRRSPKSDRAISYELVAFTRHAISETGENYEASPFHAMECRFGTLFTTIARYSTVAALKPGDCCEIPQGKGAENACVVFDEFTRNGEGLHIGSERYRLLLCIEVHHAELEYARASGNDALFAKLKVAGHYPYSDLDRESVV